MIDFFISKGIIHQRTYEETPNKIKLQKHILNVAWALFFQYNLQNFWNFSIQHAKHMR